MTRAKTFHNYESDSEIESEAVDFAEQSSPLKLMHQVFNENIQSFDSAKTELFIAAITNLSDELDSETYQSILQNNEFTESLINKINDPNLQIQHNVLHAINKLIFLGSLLSQESLLQQKLNLIQVQKIILDKILKNYETIFEAFEKNLFANLKNSIKDLKKIILMNGLCVQTVEKIILVSENNVDFQFIFLFLDVFEKLLFLTYSQSSLSEELKLQMERCIQKLVSFLYFLLEFDHNHWTFLLQRPKTIEGLFFLLGLNNFTRLDVYKIIKNGLVNGLKLNEQEFLRNHEQILLLILQFSETYKEVASNGEFYSTGIQKLKPILKVTEFIEYLLDENQETSKNETRFENKSLQDVRNFFLLTSVVDKILNEFNRKIDVEKNMNLKNSDEKWKSDLFLKGFLEQSISTLFSLIKYTESIEEKQNMDFWTNLFAFFESKCEEIGKLICEDFEENSKIILNFSRSVLIIYEEIFKSDGRCFKKGASTIETLTEILINVFTFLREKNESKIPTTEKRFHLSENDSEKNAEETSSNLIDLIASSLDYKNIKRILPGENLSDFLASVWAYLNCKNQNLLVSVHCIDGIMTIFSDDNLDHIYFANGAILGTELGILGGLLEQFFISRLSSLDSEQREYIQEVLENLVNFLDYKLSNRK